jgi:hypothetical protein
MLSDCCFCRLFSLVYQCSLTAAFVASSASPLLQGSTPEVSAFATEFIRRKQQAMSVNYNRAMTAQQAKVSGGQMSAAPGGGKKKKKKNKK